MNNFVFLVYKGKQLVPCVMSPIKGWHKLKPKVPLLINPFVLSLGGAFDIVVDPAIIVEKKRKKMQKKKVEKQIEENEEEEFDFENQTDSEDEQASLVKWCAEEEFKRGKPRSVDTLMDLQTEKTPQIMCMWLQTKKSPLSTSSSCCPFLQSTSPTFSSCCPSL